jgi:hypothetical protein
VKRIFAAPHLLILGLAFTCLLVGSVAASATTISGVNEAAYDVTATTGEQQLASMQAAGVRAVRSDASWGGAQPSAPTASGPGYQFGQFDTLVGELADHNMSWLPIVDYSAPWAASLAGNPFSAPASDTAYAAYAQALAGRYGAGGSFWAENPQLPYEPVHSFEVWNEENSTMFWAGAPQPAQYAALYMQTRAAIDAVDPTAQVIVGGLLEVLPGPASQFVEAMFKAQPSLRGNVDGFALHPYTANAAQVLTSVDDFRQTLDALGESAAPIEVTEFGWGSGAGESWRATQMRSVAMGLANSDCGVDEISPYVWYEAPGGADYSLATLSGLLPSGSAWFSGFAAAQQAPEHHLCHPLVHSTPAGTIKGKRAVAGRRGAYGDSLAGPSLRAS